jgi:threonyl-tRNA synthetase
LLEHHGQALPAWLSPEQARILPVGEPHAAFAREVQAALRERGVRVGVDDRNESLSRRILDLHQALVPFALVVGNKEVAERSVALRSKPERSVALRSKGEQRGLGLDAALGELVAACRIPPRSAGQAALGHLAE